MIVTALALLLEPASPPAAPPPPEVVSAVPVLMYHVVADPARGAAWPHLYVPPAEFEAQLDWLERNGYTAVTLSDLWRNWHEGGRLPARPVVLTFDDGYRSVAAHALPRLAARGWRAVLNLKVGNLREPWGLSERRVRAMLAAGWELAAHTLTHPDLRTLDDVALEREVAGSRVELRRRFGVPVDFFCYPAGRYDDRVVAAVRRAGYLGATTTEDGLATPADPFRLRRIRVSRGDGVRGLASALGANRLVQRRRAEARSGASRGSAPRAPASGTPA
jgi:peptidoglycan/xylan/chitin deacetylase (PgdA/CDA1 family)